MGQVFSFQDPLPLMFGNIDEGPCFDHSHDDEVYEEAADDGWLSPGPCIICGAPYTSCTGESHTG